MATTQENNKVADTMEAKSDRENVQSVTVDLEVSVQQPDCSVEAEIELVVSDKADCEATNKVVVSTEEHADFESVSKEPTDIMHAEIEPLSTEHVAQKQTSSHSELVNPPPIGSQDHMEFYNSRSLENLDENTEFVNMEHVHTEAVSSELLHQLGTEYDNSDVSNMQLVATDMVKSDLANPETQPSKRRKKKSIVWEHFTIEIVSPGCKRALCKVCKKSFVYSTGSRVSGTSHLLRHIAKGSCPLLQNNPSTPKRRNRTSNAAPCLVFDQDRCRHEIARMIIMHEYPLHMIEHPGFVAFAQNLQPRFDTVNFNTVREDCVATYLREKLSLQKNIIDRMPGRLCLAVDTWTSSQRTGYEFLHGQFVDHEWKLNKLLLNIVMEPFPESDTALCHAVATCLSYWNSDNKLFSITFNQSVTEAGLENMRGLNGQLLVRSCLARTLSGMALDVLAAGQDAVTKIRSSVKYVKTCDANEDKFLELKLQLQVHSEKSLTLDSKTRWNTTYDMLVAACELKEVFACLEGSDAPTMREWNQAENICMHLRLLLETAKFLLPKVPPSTNVFFHEVWKIQLELTRNAASQDPFVRNVAGILLEKLLKYWKDSYVVLAIAVAMDPRFKMKLVEFTFTRIFSEEAPCYIRMVDEGIHELFQEYNNGEGVDGALVSKGLTDFDMYMMETNNMQQMKSELDQYLEESLLPRVHDIDVLGWWKVNKVKYPTLSKMARDILSVPLSSVGRDCVFESVSREMDQYRSSLGVETLEAVMCARDWFKYQQHHEAPNGHVKIELNSN